MGTTFNGVADGHEKTYSSTTTTLASDVTDVGHGKFITGPGTMVANGNITLTMVEQSEGLNGVTQMEHQFVQ